jgi:type VI secretion system protein
MYILLLSLLLSSCQFSQMLHDVKSAITLRPSKIWVEKVVFKAKEDINDSSPVKIHLIVIYKDDVLTQIGKMDAKSYFHSVDQIKTDYPGDIDIFEMDIVPGQNITAPVKLSRMDSVGGFVFAHYLTPGIHRKTIGDSQILHINLEKDDFKIEDNGLETILLR